MWVVYLFVVFTLSAVFYIDIKAATWWEAFSCRGYDVLAMVSGKSPALNVNANFRYDEYKNKSRILDNN